MRQRTRTLAVVTSLSAVVALLSAPVTTQAGHDCKAGDGHSCVAEETAVKLIEAHGGWERWQAAPTVSFKHTMVAPYEPDDPWVSVEVTDNRTRCEYQEWPLDGAKIVYDGKQVWSTDWKRANPPKFMVNLTYYFLNLPWLTQDDGVKLEAPGQGKLPNDGKNYDTLRMTFAGGVGETPDDYYVIYIDPDTGMMRGVEYVVTYGALLDLMGLPADMTSFGPLYKVFEEYTDVGGLKVPAAYRTFSADGNVYGEHKVEDFSFSRSFEDKWLEKPEGAVVDNSSAKRKTEAID